MTTPADLLTYIDRPGYERLADLASAGTPMAAKAALATHLRRGWSLHSGRSQTIPDGTRLLDGVM